ncbi:hypothetical protein [Bradyrhizobium sp.]
MTVQRARAALSLIWVMLVGPLVLLFVARSVMRFYPGELLDAWTWLVQLLFPVLGIIIAAWSVTGSDADDTPVRSQYVFWCALVLSLFYLATIYVVVGLEPQSKDDWLTVFHNSGIYLGFFQGVVVAALGKFFIENVHPTSIRRKKTIR